MEAIFFKAGGCPESAGGVVLRKLDSKKGVAVEEGKFC